MKENKIFKILLLIRNIVLTIIGAACLVIGIILLISAHFDKINDKGLSYALGLIFGIIFCVIGCISLIYSICYLAFSVKYLKSSEKLKYNKIMLAFETILLLSTLSSLLFQLTNFDILIIVIYFVVILQSVIIIIIFVRFIKRANKLK